MRPIVLNQAPEAEIARSGDPIVIGLVNNMPDAAVETTEAQFRALLEATPFGPEVKLKLFYLPDVPRSMSIRSHFDRYYQDVEHLSDSGIDGLIVTGAEPRAAALTDEPYWASLVSLIDWASDNTVSTIWSCLAAHAAVLHLDGLERRPLARKLSGVFTCRKVADHPLMNGFPAKWRVPHSRFNELPPELLDRAGYQLLSTAETAGADVFIKKGNSLFVFLQGHPEYDPAALLREYRRDVRRFLLGRTQIFPEVPTGYVDPEVANALCGLRNQAEHDRDPALMDDLARLLRHDKLTGNWHDSAALLIRNWLSVLMTHPSYSAEPFDIADPEPFVASEFVSPVVADLAANPLSLVQVSN